MESTTRGVFGIAAMLVGVAFAALLIGHSQGTAQVASSFGGVFNDLLSTVELQNGPGSFNLGAGYGGGFGGGYV